MPDDPFAFEQTSLELFERSRRSVDVSSDLIAHYLPSLRAFVRVRLSEELRRRESESDIVQSVFRDLIEGREGLRFEAEAQFRAWLFTAALNTIRDKARYWRRAKRSLSAEESLGSDRELDELSRGYSGIFTPSRIVAAREQVARLEAALSRIPEHYAEVIALARIARLSHREIARRLDKSELATRQLLGRALRQLSTELRSDTEGPGPVQP